VGTEGQNRRQFLQNSPIPGPYLPVLAGSLVRSVKPERSDSSDSDSSKLSFGGTSTTNRL
jgi:hypothetical protein